MTVECAPARVLVVDDEPVIIELVGRALRRLCVTESAPDGAEALARVHADPGFALVLSDLSMPRLSGLALLDAIRLTTPCLGSRFVIMTGGAQNRFDEDRLAVAGVPILLKPFNVRELVALVQRYLDAPVAALMRAAPAVRAARPTEPPPS
jgi:CheY-like chemotaxis protein